MNLAPILCAMRPDKQKPVNHVSGAAGKLIIPNLCGAVLDCLF